MTAVLRLSLMTPLGDSPDQQKRMLTDGSLKIGRDETNDWSLDDGSRLISRHHCTINATGGLFIIIDSSANGLFINDAKQPLGRGNSAILSNGDTLRMGNVAISVEVAEEVLTTADPFRAVLPKLGSPDLPPAIKAEPLDAPLPAAILASMAQAPPPDWDSFGLRPLPSLGPAPDENARPVTLEDHLPSEQEALLPLRVSTLAIPEDWDDELAGAAKVPPAGAEPQPVFSAPPFGQPAFSQPAAPPPRIPDRTLRQPGAEQPAEARAGLATALALVEALARIEAEILGPSEAPLLAGPPEQALARLDEEQGDWLGLTLNSLAARVISHLKRPDSAASQAGAATAQGQDEPWPTPSPVPYIPEGDLS